MKERRRSILHVDLDPFFVSVERSLDPSLRGRPVVIGGDGSGMGFVAAVSDEARQAGVRVGLPMAQAHLSCPEAAFRRGDLDAYGRHSEEVTAVLLAASRRVERPSADEAFVDLTAEGPGDPPSVRAAETIRDELQRRLGLDASLGLASSRLAARIASAWAKPRGLLRRPPRLRAQLPRGQARLRPRPATPRRGGAREGGAHDARPGGRVRRGRPGRRRRGGGGQAPPGRRARGAGAPGRARRAPAFLQEEATIRDRSSDRRALEEIADALARRVARRLKPFRLAARAIGVEVRRAADAVRRSDAFSPGLADEDAIATRVRALLDPLLDPAQGVRALQVRLARLDPPTAQAPLFPAAPALRHAR